MSGLIHIYEGNGKGKTTAGAGLALRCAGHGYSVAFAQFLKDGTSGEVNVLKEIPGIRVLVSGTHFGFSFRMNEQQKLEAADCYRALFEEAAAWAEAEGCRLLVLDEVLDACNCGLLDTDRLVEFLKHKPPQLEVVMTGRNPDPELIRLADYITHMEKIRHPYDRGIPAREAIEW